MKYRCDGCAMDKRCSRMVPFGFGENEALSNSSSQGSPADFLVPPPTCLDPELISPFSSTTLPAYLSVSPLEFTLSFLSELFLPSTESVRCSIQLHSCDWLRCMLTLLPDSGLGTNLDSITLMIDSPNPLQPTSASSKNCELLQDFRAK
jgi:hypothetical protein